MNTITKATVLTLLKSVGLYLLLSIGMCIVMALCLGSVKIGGLYPTLALIMTGEAIGYGLSYSRWQKYKDLPGMIPLLFISLMLNYPVSVILILTTLLLSLQNIRATRSVPILTAIIQLAITLCIQAQNLGALSTVLVLTFTLHLLTKLLGEKLKLPIFSVRWPEMLTALHVVITGSMIILLFAAHYG